MSAAAEEAQTILLDSGPLSLVTHPRGGEEAAQARGWLAELLAAGADVRVPEVADYEQRRELLRAGRERSVERLDALARDTDYLPLSTAVIRRAAGLWADVRRRGEPTADPKELDADAILAAQALIMAEQENAGVVVATTNPGHLSRYVAAVHWREIGPAREPSKEDM